ncbi:MAG: efflux RND transporter permease subunit [Paludibacterium sp.]|uniref:efflux RND transporter permease subunit n=1 Tax=Paludibacterium sp. TaxID=1917523 RepID=UPI0025E94182|nr:efflux RND transporter permease subunit [Paludibacterium sp.]MBV8046714.1 efflux RND transporter permease subunit [Paludibacterium sp.]
MIAKFFIERPVLANVIAWIIVLVGAVAVFGLPVSQYPQLTPPTVQVTTSYPGASALTVQQQVAQTIEQQVNGVEGMLYMQSTSSNDGRYTLTVSFAVGTDADQAQVAVQNRVAAAIPLLPNAVQQQGVVTKKKSTSILQIVTLSSDRPEMDGLFLSNFASLRLKDRLTRLPGVADVNVFGVGQYSMRVWLDPQQMKQRGLVPANVIALLNKQSQPISVGQVGAPPAPAGQAQQLTVNLAGAPNDAEDFGRIILKTDGNGAITRLRDVARIELGSQNYGQTFKLDGRPAAGVAIYQLPDANALATAQAVKTEMARLAKDFPPGLRYDVPFDTTVFVKASIDEVYQTLYEAGVLVLLVIVIFLQDWRATLVPATTVPITIIGAFAAMAAMGFSINLLTLFALVLCIGIVVDDAIVVVEGVAKYVEAGKAPREAAVIAMKELMGPIIGITLVLMSVFLPAAFIPGITGQMYRQFALVIAATALISGINAITLKPTQSAKYVRAHAQGKPKNAFFRAFDKLYFPLEERYARLVARLVAARKISALVAAGVIVLAIVGLARLPTGFIPTEDQGYLMVAVQLPDAASIQRTDKALADVTRIARALPGVEHVIAIGGISPLDGNASLANAGLVYLTLKDWDERAKHKGQDLRTMYAELNRQLAAVPDIQPLVLVPPPIPGLGMSGGFQMQLELTDGSGDLNKLAEAARRLVAAAKARPEIQAAFTPLRTQVPQLQLTLNRARAEMLGVAVNDVYDVLQSYLGSAYVGQFSKFGQNYTIYVQADQSFRARADQIAALTVRNNQGEMVPLGSFLAARPITGPALIPQYQMYPTATLNGAAAPGYSSGQALAAMEDVAAEVLPQGVGYEWTALSYQEKLVGSSVIVVFGLAILLVYLVLAGQYESWWLPVPVILAVPMSLVGTVSVLWVVGLANNIYVQIGLVLLIALSAKNAILIVEVAQEMRHEGHDLVHAALEGSRRRFRPILMTSFAFILGVAPLVLAKGAGAAARVSIGLTVFSGMLASTVLAVAFVPVLYVVIVSWRERRDARR